MSFFAFILISISAFMHATWNYLAKRSNGDFVFVWIYLVVGALFLTPIIIGWVMLRGFQISWIALLFMMGSAFIHLAYLIVLQKAYKIGDLSLIYPIARGTGPLIVALLAIFIYGERLTWLGISGIVLITSSIFIITGGVQAIKQSLSFIPILYGLFIGILISGYTLLDKGSVSIFLLSPLLLTYGVILIQLIFLTPFVLRHYERTKQNWRDYKKEAIGIGILNQFAYILVLIAMVFTPVSHVAPVREMSILIGTVIGSRVLAEGFGIRRTIAAATMVIGIAAVALSKG